MVKDFPAYLNKPQLPGLYRVFKLPEKHGLSRFSTLFYAAGLLSAPAIQAGTVIAASASRSLGCSRQPHVFSYSAALVEDRSVSVCVLCSAPTSYYLQEARNARAQFMEFDSSAVYSLWA